MSATSITKQSAWICFTACVVVTSDTMSSTPEFQRDSVSDGWITGRPNLTTFVLVKSSRSGRVIYCLRRVSALLAARLTTVSLDFHRNLLEGFEVTLKRFFSLAMINQHHQAVLKEKVK